MNYLWRGKDIAERTEKVMLVVYIPWILRVKNKDDTVMLGIQATQPLRGHEDSNNRKECFKRYSAAERAIISIALLLLLLKSWKSMDVNFDVMAELGSPLELSSYSWK